MLRVVVYGRGRAGEVVAEYLEEELGVVEVVRVVDWAPTEVTGEAWLERAEQNLARFWGRVAAIVLADCVGAGLTQLRQRHPEQNLVALGINRRLLRQRCIRDGAVALLAGAEAGEDERLMELKRDLPKLTWLLPDGRSWGTLIDRDLMTMEILWRDLARDFKLEAQTEVVRDGVRLETVSKPRTRLTLAQTITIEKHRVKLVATVAKIAQFEVAQARERAWQLAKRGDRRAVIVWPGEDADELVMPLKPAVVVLLDPRLWLWKEEIGQIFGWQVQVLDFRKKLLRDTCMALGLLGVDGERSKEA